MYGRRMPARTTVMALRQAMRDTILATVSGPRRKHQGPAIGADANSRRCQNVEFACINLLKGNDRSARRSDLNPDGGPIRTGGADRLRRASAYGMGAVS
jgi:hypothetical protein